MAVVLVTSGGSLFSLGIIAEYLGIAVKTAMGKPLYLVVTDLQRGPLGRLPWPGRTMIPAPAERQEGDSVVGGAKFQA